MVIKAFFKLINQIQIIVIFKSICLEKQFFKEKF